MFYLRLAALHMHVLYLHIGVNPVDVLENETQGPLPAVSAEAEAVRNKEEQNTWVLVSPMNRGRRERGCPVPE